MKVIYMFGAGASALALPVVNGIPTALEHFLKVIESANKAWSERGWTDDRYEELVAEFREGLTELISKVKQHASIDTYAKKLMITGDTFRYKQLKAIFSGFMFFEQMKSGDSRYNSFFASIIADQTAKLPSNIRIVSWNYDFQFEKAYSAFSRIGKLEENQFALNVNFKGQFHQARKDVFGIYKLNGSAGFTDPELRVHYLFVSAIEEDFNYFHFFGTIMRLYRNYMAGNSGMRSSLNFAWEAGINDSFLKNIGTEIYDSEICVIIGYSFPFFNRQIDRFILRDNLTSLKKVYIQDKNPETVLSNFKSIRQIDPHKVEVISSVDQFFLPPEL